MCLTRRDLLLTAMGAPRLLRSADRPLKIVVAGGHPGDPECGCAGAIVRFTNLGHHVTCLYLNRGEGFCSVSGKPSPNPCAAIRTAESRESGKILKARAVFAEQYDGRAIVDPEHYESFARLLNAEIPDIVFTQWPIDHHPDHRAVSMLVLDTWWRASRNFALYYYEVAEDTTMFSPTEYVDISPADVEARRRDACFAHASQKPEKWYPKQVELTRRRGIESGFSQAEAFLRHPESKRSFLP